MKLFHTRLPGLPRGLSCARLVKVNPLMGPKAVRITRRHGLNSVNHQTRISCQDACVCADIRSTSLRSQVIGSSQSIASRKPCMLQVPTRPTIRVQDWAYNRSGISTATIDSCHGYDRSHRIEVILACSSRVRNACNRVDHYSRLAASRRIVSYLRATPSVYGSYCVYRSTRS